MDGWRSAVDGWRGAVDGWRSDSGLVEQCGGWVEE